MILEQYNEMETIETGYIATGHRKAAFAEKKSDGNWYSEIEGLQNKAQYQSVTGEKIYDTQLKAEMAGAKRWNR
jgi:hypothetical protein